MLDRTMSPGDAQQLILYGLGFPIVLIWMFGRRERSDDMRFDAPVTSYGSPPSHSADFAIPLSPNIAHLQWALDADTVAAAFRDDPAFSQERFLAYAETLFVLLRLSGANDRSVAIKSVATPEFAQAYAATNTLQSVLALPAGAPFRVERASIVACRQTATEISIDAHFDVKEDERRAYCVTLTRSAHARTQIDGALAARICPACGAPASLESFFRCAACGAMLESSGADWRIFDIHRVAYKSYDESDYGTNAMAEALVGFAQISAGDPGFSADVLRNRLQLLYYNILNAENAHDAERGRPNMSTPLYIAWRANAVPQGDRAAVAARTVQIISAEAIGVQRGAYFDGVRYLIEGRQTAPALRDFREIWSLQRAVGVPTVDRGIAEQCCPHCGAEIALNEVGECRFCRVTVVNGEFDWVVTRISDLGTPHEPRWTAESFDVEETLRIEDSWT